MIQCPLVAQSKVSHDDSSIWHMPVSMRQKSDKFVAVKKCADVQSILLDLLGEKVGINNIMDSDVSFLEF